MLFSCSAFYIFRDGIVADEVAVEHGIDDGSNIEQDWYVNDAFRRAWNLARARPGYALAVVATQPSGARRIWRDSTVDIFTDVEAGTDITNLLLQPRKEEKEREEDSAQADTLDQPRDIRSFRVAQLRNDVIAAVMGGLAANPRVISPEKAALSALQWADAVEDAIAAAEGRD